MPQWQPIETAPKDGTKIVIWSKLYASFCPIAAWCTSTGEADANGWEYDPWYSPPCAETDGFLGTEEDIEGGAMPTHWMPLSNPNPQNDKKWR